MRWTNLIALFRIAILPVMIWLIYYETKISYIWAIFLFFMALGSDFLQGYLMIGGEKKVGSFFDPFADKILIMGVLFVFFLRGSFSLWLWVLFILRDVIIMIFRWLASVEDIQVLSKWHHKIMTNAELGIVFGLLII